MEKSKFAVIFDMDGVLVNSTEYVGKSFEAVLKRDYGIKTSTADRQLGLPLKYHVKKWNQNYNLDIDVENFSRKATKVQLELMEKIKPENSLIRLLDSLRKNNVSLAVATSSMKYRADELLRLLKITDYFDVLVAADDVKRHKPHPDTFLEAAKRMYVKPVNCVVIEDALAGVQAAKAGKMKVVGYLTKHNKKSDFKCADLVISSFSEISYSRLQQLFSK